MVSNRGRNTKLEIALRKELHGRGLRFRIHLRPLPGVRCEADVVFTRLKLAVFVDGCFWHGCPDHATYPMANGEWWLRKLEGNRARDQRNDSLLRDSGWTVLRLWEHEPVAAMAQRVVEVVAGCSRDGARSARAPRRVQ